MTTSFGSSGTYARLVSTGQRKPDVVAFAVTTDMNQVVRTGRVDPSWNKNGTQGRFATSEVVLVVRKGNPKKIEGWADLTAKNTRIASADPATAGAARWNLLAAWGQERLATGSTQKANAYLGKVINNVSTWAVSGSAATDAFLKGDQDVLITYENEAISMRADGKDVDYVVPDRTPRVDYSMG